MRTAYQRTGSYCPLVMFEPGGISVRAGMEDESAATGYAAPYLPRHVCRFTGCHKMPTVVIGEVAFQHTNFGVQILTGNGLKIHRTDSLPPYDMQAITVERWLSVWRMAGYGLIMDSWN